MAGIGVSIEEYVTQGCLVDCGCSSANVDYLKACVWEQSRLTWSNTRSSCARCIQIVMVVLSCAVSGVPINGLMHHSKMCNVAPIISMDAHMIMAVLNFHLKYAIV